MKRFRTSRNDSKKDTVQSINMNSYRNNTVIILLGPTAVGKTGVSSLLAKALKAEIISADAVIRRHLMGGGITVQALRG